ncbi:MAG: DUF3883 domain-containing protein [Candidatus Electryonea clarkiae]|nr:DUF3883 domain-containing protein [Candidatus Electryonea clarkiae]MDP8287635.1 DUF3883 domain-containing protein [Candidatus Electryonea clarkiae]
MKTGELERRMHKIMLIDSTTNVKDIINSSIEYGLLVEKSERYLVTSLGNKLAKLQKRSSWYITDPAKLFLLKNVYLNLEAGNACCKNIILKFQVDTIIGTFILKRQENESNAQRMWLQILSRVDLIEVDERLAKIKKEHLGLVNEFLFRIRRGEFHEDFETENEKNQVGKIAEENAFEYEKIRLKTNGHTDLLPFIQHTSLVDNSAGYDILSFQGTGKNPETKIYIEVKGTRRKEISFFWSRNERKIADRNRKQYWIYAYKNIKIESNIGDGPIRINNPITNLERQGYNITPLSVHVDK